jgi:hypothetical protein
MRTTLTLDPDVAALLKKAVAKGDRSFKDLVNAALRKGLDADGSGKPKKRWVQRVGPPGEFLIDINDNAAIQEMWDREDYPDLYRREPPPVRDEP